MPELKNTFTGGRMEKDQDERIVGTGLYREALNIEVATSEDSDVGAVQNILGNIKVTEAIAGPLKDYNGCVIGTGLNRYYGTNKHITHTVDPQNDKLYRFIATNGDSHGVWMDRIVEYDTNSKIENLWQTKERAVMVDIYKVATKVTAINVPPNPPPPPEIKYGCVDNACVDCVTNSCVGLTYANDPTCGGTCTVTESWECDGQIHMCVDPGTGTGQYPTEAACVAAGGACGGTSGINWDCTDASASNYNALATHNCDGTAIGTTAPGWDSCCVPVIGQS